MTQEEEMQEKAIQFELMKQQVEATEKQLMELEDKTQELRIVQQSINELRGQSGKEILVPVGSGVFLKGSLVSDDRMLVELGANVVAEKGAAETVGIIENQIKEIDKLKNSMREEMVGFVSQMERMEPEIVEYYSKKR